MRSASWKSPQGNRSRNDFDNAQAPHPISLSAAGTVDRGLVAGAALEPSPARGDAFSTGFLLVSAGSDPGGLRDRYWHLPKKTAKDFALGRTREMHTNLTCGAESTHPEIKCPASVAPGSGHNATATSRSRATRDRRTRRPDDGPTMAFKNHGTSGDERGNAASGASSRQVNRASL